MSFRARVFLAVFAVFGLLLTGLGYWARSELIQNLEVDHQERVEAEWSRFQSRVVQRNEDIVSRVAAVATHLERDSAFRLALLGQSPEARRDLVDHAPRIVFLTGLDYLEILSEDGHVLSSAQFRSSYGTERSGFRGLSGGVVRVEVPTEHGSSQGWAVARSVRIGERTLVVWGGVADEVGVEDGGAADGAVPDVERKPATSSNFDRAIPVVRIDLRTGDRRDVAEGIVVDDPELQTARRSLDRTLLGGLAASLAAGLFLSIIVSRWIDRPVRHLIDKTLEVRLGRSRVRFEADRSDEFGELETFIGSMIRRLEDSSEKLREAERRATVGEIARQVHHDVRNGVVPLRGVIRHLDEVAEREPGQLAGVFRERFGTLESGLAYLEGLSTQYARITQRTPLVAVRLQDLVPDLARSWETAHHGLEVRVKVGQDTPPVQGDELGLRRVLENLARNAIDAMLSGATPASRPRIGVTASETVRRDRRWVELEFRDEGPGMDEDTVARVFEPFYSTRPDGTGLGLSIVRRLVTDFGGSIDVESSPGAGTTFRLLLPVWGG
ncbi:MAG: HAMP domain-containing sensor histidine kinase [Candidatus Eisenbacteria bacterium]